MAAQAPGQITWTLLPAGWADDGSQTINLTLVATPQLVSADPAATIQSFPLFNGDGSTAALLWPDQMKVASFILAFNAIGPITVTPNPAAIDSSLWKLVFPDTLLVGSFPDGDAQAVANQATQSYSVQTNLNAVYRVIHTTPVYSSGTNRGKNPPNLNAIHANSVSGAPSGASQAGYPTVAALAHLVPNTEADRKEIKTVIHSLRARHKVLKPEHLTAHAATTKGKFTPEMLAFAEMDDFYSGLSAGAAARYAAATQNSPNSPVPLTTPALDFHSALTAISRYPALMRALGLILDFTVSVTDLAGIGLPSSYMSMSPAANPIFSGYSFLVPNTLYQFNGTTRTFCLGSNGTLPDLADGFFAVPPDVRVPISLRLDSLASFLPRQIAQFKQAIAADANATAAPMLAPNTAGLGLARSGNNGLVVTLTTMLQQQAALGTAPTPIVSSETLTRGFRVDIQPQGATTWNSLHQRIGTATFNATGGQLKWTDEGWTTFQAFNPTPDGPTASLWTHETIFLWQGWSLSAPRPGKMSGQDGALLDQSAAGTSNLEFSVNFAVAPGSLPLLRFGISYNCRLRAVDLAGYSLPLSAATPDQYSTSLGSFLRYEPAPPPVLVMRDPAQPGETNGTIVLRSDFNTPPLNNAERLIAPPSTSLQMAEWHGALDLNGLPNPALFNDPTFIARLNGSFTLTPYGATPPGLPYLPDPAVTGAILDFNPGTTDPVTSIAFDGAWPALNCWRLILEEGDFAVVPDPVAHTVTVSLPKATVYSINLAAALDDAPATGTGGIGLFDYWSQIATGAITGVDIPTAHAGALNGRTAQLTPARAINLIHAVQRPLIVSTLPPDTYMTRNGTVALMHAIINLDPTSTGKVEVLAQWHEWVDDGVTLPYQQYHQGSVVQATLNTNTPVPWTTDAAYLALPPVEHEMYDTKARQVTYSVVTTTSFMEYFPASITDDPTNVTQISPPVTLNVPAGINPPAPKVLYAVPLLAWQTSGAATQTRTGGVRIYLDRPWYVSGDGEQLGVVIPITAPPPPPDNGNGNGNGGGGGVKPPVGGGGGGGGPVAFTNTPPAPAPPTAPPEIPAGWDSLVTQWGADPATQSSVVPSPFTPLPQHLPTGILAQHVDIGSFPNYRFPYSADSEVTVLSYPVQFEPPDPVNPSAPADPNSTPNNGRWYADIEIDTGEAYFPFLRLALTRYQSYGANTELYSCSEIVLADFVQIAPGRTVTLTPNPDLQFLLTVTVAGPPNLNGNTIYAQVEIDRGSNGTSLWIPGTDTVLASTASGVWSQLMTLPADRGTVSMRIVIREFENWPVDAPGRYPGVPPSTAQRLVFVNTLSLDNLPLI